MTSLTIQAEYNNWVIKPIKKIKKAPSRVYITLEYDEDKDSYKNKWYYKNIETSLNKVWENDGTSYSLKDIQNV